MTTKTAWAARYVPTAVTRPWLSGVPTRCTQAAHPAPSTKPRTAPRVSHTASAESSRLSAAQRAAIENGTANTSATVAPARIASQSQRIVTGDASGHGGGPNGDGSPSLPGLRMPSGSSASLSAGSTPKAGPSASAMKRARLMPTPWWCDRLPPPASTARWPASHSATYVASTSSGGGVAANVKYRQAPSG